MKAEEILEKHFRKGMINKDFNSFKKTHPTLTKCVLDAINEALNQQSVSSEVKPTACSLCGSENLEDCGGLEFSCNDCGHFPIFVVQILIKWQK